MKTVTATQARKDIYNLIEAVALAHKPIEIISKKADAILISKEDWEAIQETLYLYSIPGIRESIQEGVDTPISKCKKLADIDW